jgi:PKD repeat protein
MKPYYSLILSAILLLQILAISINFTPREADATHIKLQSPQPGDIDRHQGKFIAYADFVELKGTLVHRDDGELYIVPDKNYENLLTKGNHEYPRHQGHYGYAWYRDNILADLPAAGFPPDSRPPIIKLEEYGYCERLGSNECYPDNANPDAPRQLEPGDRIRIMGVYALDNAHSWYSAPLALCDFPSARWQFNSPLKICFNHAEFHPYRGETIVLLEPLEPGEPNVESHIVVAPVYEEYYSHTWPPNISKGLSCTSSSWLWRVPFAAKPNPCDFTTLVDSTVKRDITSEFFIEAPPKPAECTADVPCEMALQESNITRIGNANVVEKVRQENGWLIKVRAVARDATNDPFRPSIYKATWSVNWSAGPDNVDPNTSITRAEDGAGREIRNSSISTSISIRFTFSGTDNVGVERFECSLDGSAPSPCPGNTIFYNQITEGTHTFQVAAIDPAGNVDKTPATFTWRMETRDIPPICIVRPWLPQCDPSQQSLTTQETPPPPSEQETTAGTTTATDNQTATEEPAGTAATEPTTRTGNEPVQESAELTPSQEQAVLEPLTVQLISNATQGIVPATFQFDANITGDTEPYDISWNFGDGNEESDEERVLHTFEEAGTYDVTLTVTDSNGETLSDSMEVQVLEPEEEPLEEDDEEDTGT